MSGIKEAFGLISEAISTMAESGSDWPYLWQEPFSF